MNILFDIGATKIRVAKSVSGDSFDKPVIFLTSQKYEEGIVQLKKVITKLSGGETIDNIIGCIAGLVNQRTKALVYSHNLEDWVHKSLKNDLETFFGCNAYLDNDAAMVGLGEAVYGAGAGLSQIMYITVSTGVGGALIADKKIKERLEPGTQIMNTEGSNLESLIGGLSIEKKMGKKAYQIVDTVFWDRLAKTLAQGLVKIIDGYSLDAIILGGSMMNTIGISVETTEKYLKEMIQDNPQLKKATLRDVGGLYGALAYLKNI